MSFLSCCSLKIENTSHYLLPYNRFTLYCIGLMNSVKPMCDNIESMSDKNKLTLLLYGDSWLDDNKLKSNWNCL